ncbi:Presequence protease, mitochondrial [Rhizoctonia solani]|uniref:Presequence protease, mitochondrial n=1 Tax=Rhizoctonia solani TaxID=456999 RepID=A0A0K6FR03_9AGAM|nr:Presequence protease, mitochondrial [Rhizoctonia solani]
MPDDSRVYLSKPQRQRIPQSTVFLDDIIEAEFKDAIFYDPNFFRNFFRIVPSATDVVGLCRRYDWYLHVHNKWNIPEDIDDEKCLHQPVLHILNTVKSATDAILGSLTRAEMISVSDPRPGPPQYQAYHGPINRRIRGLALPDKCAQYFEDWSTRDLGYTQPDKIMLHLRPDIILFHNEWRSWTSIKLIVEIVEDTRYLAAGIKQLACYAFAIFAHQPWRRHWYSLLICGEQATFVRFDRAGVLYSCFLNIANNPTFAVILASLLSLDTVDQGIDAAFSFAKDSAYINLPESMLGKARRPDVGNPMITRQFRILRTFDDLSSKRRVVGSGTSLFRIREHLPPGPECETENSKGKAKEGSAGRIEPAEYVLKLSWRLDDGRPEGEALEDVDGVFGIPQYVSHGDITISGECRCSPPGVHPSHIEYRNCVDRTPVLPGLRAFRNFRDVLASIPPENVGGVSQAPRETLPTSNATRRNRIYSYVLTSSIGTPMERAVSPRIYVRAMMDAILGYWGLYNRGIIHRESTRTRRTEIDHRIQYGALVESEKQLREALRDTVGTRSPIGMLVDLSSHQRLGYSKASLTPEVVGENRALPHKFLESKDLDKFKVKRRKGNSGGSVAKRVDTFTFDVDGPQPDFGNLVCCNERFYSIRVARMIMTPELKYQHHFYDDLESFFWVMLWTAISHVDSRGKERSESATRYLANFHQTDPSRLDIGWKEMILDDCLLRSGAKTIAMLDASKNSWASSRLLQVAIVTFGFQIGALREEEQVSPPAEVFDALISALEGVMKTES